MLSMALRRLRSSRTANYRISDPEVREALGHLTKVMA